MIVVGVRSATVIFGVIGALNWSPLTSGSSSTVTLTTGPLLSITKWNGPTLVESSPSSVAVAEMMWNCSSVISVPGGSG